MKHKSKNLKKKGMDPFAEYKGGCPPTLPKPLPGCPKPSTDAVDSQITGLFFHPVDRPPLDAKDWQHIKFPEGGLKSGGLIGKPTIRMDFGNGKDHPTEFIWRNAPGQDPEVLVRESTLTDKLMSAVIKMKEGRKKIEQIDRAIRLINTADSCQKIVSRVTSAMAGKEQPLKDDYDRLHESIIDTLKSQKSYLEMLNNTQSIDGGQKAPQVEKEYTYQDHLTMFIRNLLWRIDELEEARQAQMATIERGGAQIEQKDREVQEYIKNSVWEKTLLQRKIDSLEVEVKTRISDEEKHKAEVAALNKTIAGLRSAITRMGGKTRPPRKRKK